MNKLSAIVAISLCLGLASCGPTVEEKARDRMNLVRSLLEKNDTTAALLQIDSIARLYPKATYSVNAAQNLKKEILWEVLQRKETELDSVKAKIARLETHFEKEKTEFDRYTQYVHKRQTFQRSWNRSYIQVRLDERGEIWLLSNYYGEQWLDHTGLRVYDQGDQARTDSIAIGSVDNHRSDFMEFKWEKVTYRNGHDNGVLEFIANHPDRRLKAVFLGKRYHYIVLEDYDKIAVKEALELSKAIRDCQRLEAETKQLQAAQTTQ